MTQKQPPDGAVAGFFRALSGLRRGRIVHPGGPAYRAVVRTESALAAVLPAGAQREAIVRFSRAGGFPEPLPDVLGLALKLPDAHGPGADQDFLLVSSANGPLVNLLMVPAHRFLVRPYSCILPYRAGGARLLVGALPPRASRRRVRSGLAELAVAAERGELRFELALASRWSRWHTIGSIEIGAPLPPAEAETLRFNPWNCGGGLQPAGFLNSLRDAAYSGSQRGRLA